MAGRKSEIPFEKKSISLGVGDFARMQKLFPQMGATVAIRTLIRNYIRQIEASAAPIDIDLNPEIITEILHDERNPAAGASEDRPEAHSGNL